ncbi:glycolate oxidase subunit GlcF [Mariprofundus sp. NF]|uniref:glycolate oxidase subunit GlcF n=1 Tax=Mariprofundus sp. NF TaxID=2608716 RepID=UPI0015A1A798|nr:glycolate oxidase subunit GlcF [Mariprofundus sp. NF]NWF39242.1 glycolate oxidase subunit GlcF [Mariprofundus sp. NF]
MQTKIPAEKLASEAGREADRILRSCVHCGFCTATCPTYQLLGDELDGPRGRIYLIKEMLESGSVTDKTRDHLDRCLTCRSCESTCPSGVEYAHLLDIGRELCEAGTERPMGERLHRKAMVALLPNRARFSLLLKGASLIKPLLPKRLKASLPSVSQTPLNWPQLRHERKVLLIEGCVQPVLDAGIDRAAAIVLDRAGISVQRTGMAQCCGALEHHLNATDAAHKRMRSNIDHWWPYLEAGVEAIISTASACALQLKEYGYLLRNDPAYAEKAKQISALTADISELIARQELPATNGDGEKIAFHASCTLQHGQKLSGVVEAILSKAGYELVAVNNSHLCCGAAGTYTLLQPEIGEALSMNKIESLEAGQPARIATANIGCMKQIEAGSEIPVVHWIELLAELYEKPQTDRG